MCPHIDFRYLHFKEGEKAVVLKMSLKDHCDDDKNHGDEQTNPDAMGPRAAGRTRRHPRWHPRFRGGTEPLWRGAICKLWPEGFI